MFTIKAVERTIRNHRDTLARINSLEMLLNEGDRAFLLETIMQQDESKDDTGVVALNCTEIAHAANLHEQSYAKEQLRLLQSQARLVDVWLSLLNPEERFILETHTIGGLDWQRTIIEHEKMWGREQGRSDRTLKRLQAKAIRKIWLASNLWFFEQEQN